MTPSMAQRAWGQVLENRVLGKTLDWFKTDRGRKTTASFAFFMGLIPSELSVVFDEQSRVVYWIGPTSALPPHAKTHQTLTA